MEPSKVDLTAKLPYRVPPDVFLRSAMKIQFLLGLCVLYVPFRILKDNQGFSWVLTLIPIAISLSLIRLSLRKIYYSGILSVDENGIHHVSMFVKKRSILWDEIDQIVSGTQDSFQFGSLIKGSLGKVNPSIGPYLMIITRKGGANPFLINIKPYTTRGMATFVHFLTVKAKTAKIDEKTLKIMQGIFPSVFVGEAKSYW
jgi:hypothetical protein